MRMPLASTSDYSALKWWGLNRNPHCMRATTGVQPFTLADQRVVPILYARLPAWLRCGMQIARQSTVPRATARATAYTLGGMARGMPWNL